MLTRYDNPLKREELLDGRVRIGGYRYSLLNPDSSPSDYLDALLAEKVKDLAEHRISLICMTLEQWDQADFASIVGPNTMFQLQAPEPAEIGIEWLSLLQEIRHCGAGIALSVSGQFTSSAPHLVESLGYAQWVVLDFTSYTDFPDVAVHIKQWRHDWGSIDIVVENLPSWYDQVFCLSMGARYSLGSFVFTDRDNVLPKD